MKATFLKLSLAVCVALVAGPSLAQPAASAPAASAEAAAVALPHPACRCPGMVTRRFRSPMLARRWAASVRCGRSACRGHRPCLRNVSFRRVGYMTVATVRCRCRLGY